MTLRGRGTKVTVTHGITKKYLDNVTDTEMFVRAVPGSNHLAWQLGHLVASERSLLEAIGAEVPDLPEGFAEKHGKDNTASAGSMIAAIELAATLAANRMSAANAAAKRSDPAAWKQLWHG